MKLRPLICLALLPAASCQRETAISSRATPVSHEQAAAQAASAAQAAYALLSGELATAIANGGPPSAVKVCSDEAPALLQRISGEQGLKILRRSDRPRNPAQAADARDLVALTAFQAAIARGEKPAAEIEQGPDNTVTVRLPITIAAPLCLQCHGSAQDIAPETLATLRELYPEDLARGYRLNDLRGLWLVTIPPEPAPQ